MAKVRISLEEGTVFCTPDKGNVWAKNGGELVEWVRGRNVMNFRLHFYREAMQGHARHGDWPFATAPDEPPNGTGVVTAFGAKVADGSGVFEYRIEVNVESTAEEAPTAYLDPMIIVGRG